MVEVGVSNVPALMIDMYAADTTPVVPYRKFNVTSPGDIDVRTIEYSTVAAFVPPCTDD